MNSLTASLLAFVAVAAATAGLVRVWIRISLRARILDLPTHRSSHATATPRGGGVGIVTGVVGGIGAVAWFTGTDATAAAWFCALAVLVAGISFVDDIRSLPSLVRLLVHFGVAVAAVEMFGAFATLQMPFAGEWSAPPWFMYALTVIWIVGVTNVYNFMDGIDGIAGGQGVVAGLAWAGLGASTGNTLVSGLGLVLAAACAGFLLLNWSPARVFMGDVGSAFLGFTFGVIPLLALRPPAGPHGSSAPDVGTIPIFAVLVLWPFLADGAFTFIRRVLKRENVLAAHRSHLYQRLTIAGWAHAGVARVYIAWAALTSLLGATYLQGGAGIRAFVAASAMATLTIMALYVHRLEKTGAQP